MPEFNAMTDLPRYPDYVSAFLGYGKYNNYDRIDAIVVPSARGADDLGYSARLAGHIGKPLVVLGSHLTRSTDVAEVCAGIKGLEWYSVDVPEDFGHPLFSLSAQHEIPIHCRTNSDLSVKRNIGLCLARTILFLDDDKRMGKIGGTPHFVSEMKEYAEFSLNTAAGLLGKYAVIGFLECGYPDKSMLHHVLQRIRRYHLERHEGSVKTASYISGNALLVNTDDIASHFPLDIYNEDWLFAYDEVDRGRVIMSNAQSSQLDYNPFLDSQRPVREEFGDLVAEALYQRKSGLSAMDPDSLEFWKAAAWDRRKIVERLMDALEQPVDNRYRTIYTAMGGIDRRPDGIWRQTLQAILATGDSIEAESYLDYYRSWRNDQEKWRDRWAQFKDQPLVSISDRLKYLGLDGCAVSSID